MAQALTFAAAPILSRLYGPDEFGVLGVFVAMSAILLAAAGWTYEQAIVLPKYDQDAANILALTFLVIAFTALLSVLVIALAGDQIVHALNNPDLATIIWWVPFSVLLASVYRLLTFWGTRQKNFKSLSLSQIMNSGGRAGSQTLAGLARIGPAGLIGGHIAGNCLGVLVLGGQIYRQDGTLIRQSIKVRRIMELAREHYKFPMYTLPQSIMNATSQNLPIFLLAYFFDPTVAGLYWFTARLMRMPSKLISTAVSRVFYKKAVDIRHDGGDLFSALKKAVFGLVAIGIFPTAIVVAFGPFLFEIIFGAAWYQAGVYAQWLVIWWFLRFVSAPTSVLVPVFGLQRISLAYHAGLLISRALAISLGALLGNEITAIALYSIISAIFIIFFASYIFIFANRVEQAQKT